MPPMDGAAWLGLVVALAAAPLACATEPPPAPAPDAGVGDAGPSFVPVALPELGPDPPNLFDIWGSGPDDVYAVGEKATILHYDGQAWAKLRLPASSSTSADLFSVWGTDPDNVYVVGAGGTILRRFRPSGGEGPEFEPRWVREPSGTSAALHAVHGSDPDHVVAVGSGGTILSRDPMMGWTAETGVTQETLNGVWIGDRGRQGVIVGNLGLILNLGEGRWRRQRISGLTQPLRQVAGERRGRLYILGLDGILLRANQDAWSEVEGTPRTYLRDLWVSGGRDAWAVGWNGTLIQTDGQAVESYPTLSDYRLEGIWGAWVELEGAEPDDAGVRPQAPVIWAVGVSGQILRGP
jgi:photosystem II stability/assembly factor-like uncharacterized protein